MTPTRKEAPCELISAANTTSNDKTGGGDLKPVKSPTTSGNAAIFDAEISMVANATDTATTTTSLRQVLTDIRSGKYQKQVQSVRDALCREDGRALAKQAKKALPGALFSGKFTRRANECLERHSGVICTDIDEKENPNLAQEIEQTLAKIENDPHTLAVFLSPSGTGLKVLCRCDPERPHHEAFRAAQHHFREQFGITIDRGCGDVSRICFVSHDPDLFARDDAAPLPTVAVNSKVNDLSVSANATEQEDFAEMPSDFGSVSKEKVRALLAKIPPRPEYPNWLRILSAVFSTLSFSEAIEVLKEWSPEEVKDEYENKYRHRLHDIGIGTLFHFARRNGDETPPPQNEEHMASKPYTIWGPMDFEFHSPDSNASLLGDGFLQRGEFTSLIGIGGLGKTRITLWLAICQITGRDWCGLDTRGGPKRWLFLSTESGLARWQNDLYQMRSSLTPSECTAIFNNLRVLALVPDEDGTINLGDEKSVLRLGATLGQEQPDVVVIDPFADAVDGDENATADVVRSLRRLRDIQRKKAPQAAVIIIHHSRTGASNVAQAGDNFASGNFGRGSKALYSRVRCELQLAPGDRDDPNKLVLCCGKANDCEKFAPRGITFDPKSFTYPVDPSFDLQAWRDNVNGKQTGTLVSRADVVCAVRDAINAASGGTTEVPTSAITAILTQQTGTSAKTVLRRMNEALTGTYLSKGSKRGLWALGPKSHLIP